MEGDGQSRKTWIENHLTEMDGNRDGKLSQEEMMSEVNKTFTGYDADRNGQISQVEANGPGVRSAMAGFVQQHFAEVDKDADGAISLGELKALAMKMWEKYSQGEGSGPSQRPPPQNR